MAALADMLAHGGDMGRRIAAFDWATHPLGPVARWPVPLRSMLTLCIHSAIPTSIYWGPDLRLIYNDAWAPIPGPRHPDALGRPGREVWADIWDVVGPQLETVMREGRGFDGRDQLLEMERYGLPEETYWDYSFTPIVDGDGQVCGVLNQGHDVTSRVLAARRGALLLRLADALGPLEDPQALMAEAARIVGEHYGVGRAGFAEIDQDEGVVHVEHCWTDGRMQKLPAVTELSNYADAALKVLNDGEVNFIDDVRTDPRITEAERACYAAIGVRSGLVAPFHLHGRLAAVLFLHHDAPRSWNRAHAELAASLARRLWQDIARARAEAAQRAAERRQRVLIDELNHRVKNTLALVQSLALQTFRGARPEADARARFQARLAALAIAHDVLSRERWEGAPLRELVAAATHAGIDAADRIVIEGPQTRLAPRAAIALTLGLHELVANAAEHGALSEPDGRVHIRWSIADERLHLSWRESGGPPVAAPDRRGFGLRLIERALPSDLAGAVALSFEPCGLGMTLDAPAPSRRAAA